MDAFRWPRTHRSVGFILAFGIASLTWVLSTPIEAGPDDPVHIQTAACALGERPGTCDGLSPRTPEGEGARATVTFYTGEQFRAALYLGEYPGGFHAVGGLVAGTDRYDSALRMRLVNWALLTGLLAWVLLTLPRRGHRALMLALTVGSVPLGLFLFGTNNASLWSVVAVPLYAAGLWGVLFSPRAPSRWWWGLAATAVAGLFSVWSRADAGAYVVAVTVLLVGWRLLTPGATPSRGQRIGLLTVTGALSVMAIWLALRSTQTAVLGTGFGDTGRPRTSGLLLDITSNVLGLYSGALGASGLGWFDIPMPAIVSVTMLAVCAGLLFFGLRPLQRGRAIAIAILAALMIGLPILLLWRAGQVPGEGVQPRYLLPLLTTLLVLVLLPETRHPVPLGRAQRWVVVGGVGFAATMAQWYVLRHHLFGADGGGVLLAIGGEERTWRTGYYLSGVGWQVPEGMLQWAPPVGTPLLLVLLGGATMVTAAIIAAGDQRAVASSGDQRALK